jgi:hypothetical protein
MLPRLALNSCAPVGGTAGMPLYPQLHVIDLKLMQQSKAAPVFLALLLSLPLSLQTECLALTKMPVSAATLIFLPSLFKSPVLAILFQVAELGSRHSKKN